MRNELSTNILRFLVMIFFQILILNNIQLGSLFVPFGYIWFILRLPLRTPPWVVFILSFLTGCTVDLFMLSPGMHAFACVLAGASRHLFIKTTVSHEQFDAHVVLSVSGIGYAWFLRYASTLIIIHHMALFLLEAFDWLELPAALLRATTSSIFTLVWVLIFEYLTLRKR